jgi:thiamine pyrophosphokinase
MSDTCLLVLAGNPPSEELLSWRVEEARVSIAVDGGILPFINASLDLVPDIILGDLDSLPESENTMSEFPHVKLVHMKEQDTTDFEKALFWVKKNTNLKKLIILGGLGKRTDHLVTNLLVASVIDESLQITFDDDCEWIQRVTPFCPLRLNGRKGSNLSILPIRESIGVQTKGLKWELVGETIGGSRIIGQSNSCLSDSVEISCASGSFYVFLEKG